MPSIFDTFTPSATAPLFDSAADVREILARLPYQVFNVRGYGAKADGVTDDGPAFNRALAAALAGGGGVVEVPAGTYLIQTQVVYPGSGIAIRGAGIGRTILKDSADFGTGMIYAVGRSNIALRDMTIQPQVTGNGYGFYFAGTSTLVTDILVDNVFVDQLRASGSGWVITGLAGGMRRVTVRQVHARSPGASTGIGGQAGGGDTGAVRSYDLLLDGCTFDGFTTGFQNGANGVWTGVRITSCRFTNAVKWGAYLYHMDQAQVVNSEFSACDVGAFMDDDTGFQGGLVANCMFRDNTTMGLYREEWAKGAMVGCSFQGNGYGMVVTSGQDVAITGCVFYKNTRDGILVDSAASITSIAGNGQVYAITNSVYIQDLTIAGCVISGNSRNGIEIGGVQRGCTITGCTIAQNGQADNPTPTNYADVYIHANSAPSNSYLVSLVGCTIGNLGGSGTDTGYSKWGVRTTASQLTELNVIGCRFEGIGTPIDVTNAALVVKGCVFSGCGPVAVPAVIDWHANNIAGGTMTPPSEVKGADVTAANNLVLVPRVTGAPNVYRINGTTQINLLSNAGWPSGSIVVLIFTANPIVKASQTPSGANRNLGLAGGVDFNATANDTLTLVYDGELSVAWYEIARAVI